jgi:hypothetical protein
MADAYVTWPLEDALTPAALAHLETAARNYHAEHMAHDTPVAVEVLNFANKIAAHLQHVAADAPAESTEEWLDT